MSCNAVECRGGKGTNLTDFLLCPNKLISTFDFRYIYIDTVRHSQVGNVISICLCSHLSLSLHKREGIFDFSWKEQDLI